VALCSTCDKSWCQPCTKTVNVQGHGTTLSPCCRAGLDPIAPFEHVDPFWSNLQGTFTYVLRGEGRWLLLFFWLLSLVPIIAILTPVLVLAYAVHVLRESARGPGPAPEFPDMGDGFNGLVWPALRVIGAGLIAWFPWILIKIYGGMTILEPLLLIVGLVVFPAILLLAACTQSIVRALSPRSVFVTMRGLGIDYLVLVLAVVIFYFTWNFIGNVGELMTEAGWFTPLIQIYLVLTLFHICGRTVWQSRDRIDWEI